MKIKRLPLISILFLFCLLCNSAVYAQSASDKSDNTGKRFIDKLSLNFLVMPDYVSSFDNTIKIFVKDGTKNLGEGIKLGSTVECTFTKRSSVRLGIYDYYESPNFEAFPVFYLGPGLLADPNQPVVYGKINESGIDFPLEYKYTFINKYKKLKVYFVAGFFLEFIYHQEEVGVSPPQTNQISYSIPTVFQLSDHYMPLEFKLGINYSISNRMRLYVEPAFIPILEDYIQFIDAYTGDPNNTMYSLSLAVGVNYKL